MVAKVFEYITEHEFLEWLLKIAREFKRHSRWLLGCCKGVAIILNHFDCFNELLCGSWGVQIG